MERRIYIVQNYDTGVEKLVKLTEEQAGAILWFLNTFDICDYSIDDLSAMDDIDAP